MYGIFEFHYFQNFENQLERSTYKVMEETKCRMKIPQLVFEIMHIMISQDLYFHKTLFFFILSKLNISAKIVFCKKRKNKCLTVYVPEQHTLT
jgi:hypothetical protein